MPVNASVAYTQGEEGVATMPHREIVPQEITTLTEWHTGCQNTPTGQKTDRRVKTTSKNLHTTLINH